MSEAKPTPAELREAADAVLGRFSCPRSDCRYLAKFILSHFPADGQELITADWLREEWGWKCYGTCSMHYDHDEWTALCWREDDGLAIVAKSHQSRCYTTGFHITTRQQFRTLSSLLGITKIKQASGCSNTH